jgi:hypothetical protein
MIAKWHCFFRDKRAPNYNRLFSDKLLPSGIAYSAITERQIAIAYLAMKERQIAIAYLATK